MENHHEEPKPSNKWVATPIIAAFLFIACVVSFISFSTGQCCGKCDGKNKTEHATEHGSEHGNEDASHDESVKDNTVKMDSAAVDTSKKEEVEHDENHEH